MKKYLVVAEISVNEDYLQFPDWPASMTLEFCLEAAWHYWQAKQGKERPANVPATSLKVISTHKLTD